MTAARWLCLDCLAFFERPRECLRNGLPNVVCPICGSRQIRKGHLVKEANNHENLSSDDVLHGRA